MQRRPHGEPGGDAHREAGEHQQLDRKAHPARRLVRRAGQIVRRRPEEDLVDEARGVGDAEHAGHRGGDRHAVVARRADLQRLGEEHLLGQETVEQGHAGHRGGGHHRQRGGDRHGAVQAAQAAHVARAGLVVDDAGRHEQRRLEGGVVHGVEDRGDRRERAADAQQQRDQAEVAEGGVGEQALEVVLEDRHEGAEQQRDQAGAADQPRPLGRAGQHRPQAGEQEHAGLDHGGRVQVRRHRRGCGHRARQPEVERELRALGERAQRDQHQHGAVPGMRADQLARGEHAVELVAAGDLAHHQDPGEQAQPPGDGDDEGHARAAARIGTMVPVADEQERHQAGQLPEHGQLHQVAREHDAQHRAHEGEEEREEARYRIRRRHVVARVQHHQQADDQYQHRELPREAVQAQAEAQAQPGQPRHLVVQHLAGGDGRVLQAHHEDAGQRDHAGQPGLPVARVRGQQRGERAAHERQEERDGDRPHRAHIVRNALTLPSGGG